MKIRKLFGIGLLTISVSLTSCSPEDGKDGLPGEQGPQGEQGIQGTQGEQGPQGEAGEDGPNGADGEGFDEMTQFGAITMTLSGTRPDGVAFEDSNTFKFTALDVDALENSVLINDADPDNTFYYFNFERFLTAPDDINNNTLVFFNLEFTNLGEPTEELLHTQFVIDNYAVIGDDNKFFQLDDIFSPGIGVSDFQFTDFVFDATDHNHLSFSYSFMVLGANNDSGHELTVSGNVDVYLLEEIQ